MIIIISIIAIVFFLKFDNIQKHNRVSLLMSLFSQLKEGEYTKEVKNWIDFKTFEIELESLNEVKKKKLYDFCHFFELLATFEDRNQIKIMELKVTFNPYLKAMKENDVCKNLIQEYGFTNLSDFLNKNEF